MSSVLGGNIRAARKEAGLTQVDFARLIDLTQSGLSQIESGKITPSGETFKSIRKALRPYLGEARLNAYLPKTFTNEQPELTQMVRVKPEGARIKVLGRVAAGKPIQPFELNEELTIPAQMIGRGKQTFALQIQGHSMVGLGIFHGDIVILHENPQPQNGQVVVIQLNQYEYTIKTWHQEKRFIKLLPANPDFDEITLTLGIDEVSCIGEYAGLIRFAK
jgi:SOS-response transcriptional repressor LexA